VALRRLPFDVEDVLFRSVSLPAFSLTPSFFEKLTNSSPFRPKVRLSQWFLQVFSSGDYGSRPADRPGNQFRPLTAVETLANTGRHRTGSFNRLSACRSAPQASPPVFFDRFQNSFSSFTVLFLAVFSYLWFNSQMRFTLIPLSPNVSP